jgi:hypothetical protein
MYKGNKQLEKLLIGQGAKPSTDLLRMAIEGTSSTSRNVNGGIEIYTTGLFFIENLLKMGAEPGDTLCVAAEKGFADVADLLLKYGAKKNVRDKHGKTPYDYAKDGDSSELKVELQPNSFKLFEFLVKFRRESSPNVLKFWGGVVALICGAGISLGVLAILSGIIGVENLQKSSAWLPYVAGGITVLAYFVVTSRYIPPVIAAIFLALGIMGFGFFAFTPNPADKPPMMERLFYGEAGKGNPAPVEEIIIQDEE